jgi:hypothetical protein
LPLGHHPMPPKVPNVCYRPNNIMVEDPPSLSSNPYPPIPLDVVQILGMQRGAARTDDDLRFLLNALGPVLGGADNVWVALSPRQQTELCRHVEMRTVRDNDGNKVNDYYLGGGEIVTGEGEFGACDLLVLVRGSATVNPPGGRSPFVVRVGGSSGPEIAVFALSTMAGGPGRWSIVRSYANASGRGRGAVHGQPSAPWRSRVFMAGIRDQSPHLTASRGGVQRRKGWWWWPYHQRHRSPRPVAIARTRIRRRRSTWTNCSPRMARMAGRSTSSRSFHPTTSTDTTPGQVRRARGRRRPGTAAARGQGAGASPSSTLSGRTARRGGGRSTRCATAGPSGGACSH